ncbi:MAG: GntR family transcriptional regulator [Microbacteriaceae bacterium]|jgi:DNA-binding GntR family transcriptional regulator|nr:GntR family transcriptional regulator [Microbacteriaceae bacterium]
MQITHQPAPVRMQAVEAIRAEIISGRLPAGARLIERELTEALGVSRNTLREAYRQLEAEGFLEIRPHRGPTVAMLAPQAVADLYEVREAIECMAVNLFTLRATEEDLIALERAFEAFAAAVDHGDTVSIITTKDAFYDLLYAGTGNRELHAQARTMYGRLAGLRLKSLSQPGRPGESLFEIRQVLHTMHARDAERAAELWREHIRHAASAALKTMHPSRSSHATG